MVDDTKEFTLMFYFASDNPLRVAGMVQSLVPVSSDAISSVACRCPPSTVVAAEKTSTMVRIIPSDRICASPSMVSRVLLYCGRVVGAPGRNTDAMSAGVDRVSRRRASLGFVCIRETLPRHMRRQPDSNSSQSFEQSIERLLLPGTCPER
jgi:hypothetical protein